MVPLKAAKTSKKQSAHVSKIKVFTGGASRLSRIKLGYLLATAFLLMTTLSYVAYGYWQGHDYQVKAASYTKLLGYGGWPSIILCKTAVNTAYGRVYKIESKIDRGVEKRDENITTAVRFRINRKGATDEYTRGWWMDRWGYIRINASAVLNDRVYVDIYSKNRGWHPNITSFTGSEIHGVC